MIRASCETDEPHPSEDVTSLVPLVFAHVHRLPFVDFRFEYSTDFRIVLQHGLQEFPPYFRTYVYAIYTDDSKTIYQRPWVYVYGFTMLPFVCICHSKPTFSVYLV